MQAWGLTDKGKVRTQNQDAYQIVRLDDGVLLCVVCDGMGGAKSGNIASKLACDVFVEAVRRSWRAGSTDQAIAAYLTEAVELANQTVFEQSQLNPDFAGMGTTLVAALIQPALAIVANVGDSRAYYVNNEEILQITRDHSVVEDMIARGELTPAQARSHPRKNLITRAVGTEDTVCCDIFRWDLQEGDSLLLCTDGLSNMVSEQEMLFEMIHGSRCSSCCTRLLAIAIAAGAPDNVTSVFVTI